MAIMFAMEPQYPGREVELLLLMMKMRNCANPRRITVAIPADRSTVSNFRSLSRKF